MQHPVLAYRQCSVQGATPLGLVVMLYDGAIAALNRAITAIESQDISEKCNQLRRAQAILAQLEGTLNMERGGEVARTLKALYTYARAQILKANLENSAEVLRDVIRNLAAVRESWYAAEHQAAGSAPPPSSPVNSGPPAPPESAPHHWGLTG